MSGSGIIAVDDKTGTYSVKKTAFGELKVASGVPKVLAHFPYNINTDVVSSTTTGSGTVTHSNFMATMSTTAASSSSAEIETLGVVEYLPGSGVDAMWTAVFTTGVAGSTQSIGVGNSVNGFFVGYNGADFGVLHRNNSSDTWTAQSSFNMDTLDGNGPSGMTIDPTKGNVFRCIFQWLGFGAITFFCEYPASGEFIPFHRIKYANANTVPSISNPTLPMSAKVENTTNDTNIVLKTPSLGAYIDGEDTDTGSVTNAQSNTKSVTTENNIITIRNKTTYQSVTNQVRIRPVLLSMAADGNKNVTVNMYINTTLGGSPSYTDISTNTSVIDYDTAGTTISGGRLVASFGLGKTQSSVISIKELNLILNPGDTLTIAATSSQSNDVTAAISWLEALR